MDILDEALKLSKYDKADKDLIHSDELKRATEDFNIMDCTFYDYKVEGHGNISNPVDRISACINYICHRYGSFKDLIEKMKVLDGYYEESPKVSGAHVVNDKDSEIILNKEDKSTKSDIDSWLKEASKLNKNK